MIIEMKDKMIESLQGQIERQEQEYENELEELSSVFERTSLSMNMRESLSVPFESNPFEINT